MPENSDRESNEPVAGEIEVDERVEPGKRPRPDVRQPVVGQTEGVQARLGREDVVGEETDGIVGQRQTEKTTVGRECVRVDEAETVSLETYHLFAVIVM